MQSAGETVVVKSHFNLPTYQRRLRHLQSIAVRNLHCPRSQDIDLSALKVYFTLHKDEKHKDTVKKRREEHLAACNMNPTWQSFDLQRCDTDVDLTTKFVVVRVWWDYGQMSKVKIEAHIHLSGLVFFSSKLQIPGVIHQTNTLLFGMFNNFFIHYDEESAKLQLDQWILDKEVPKDSSIPVSVRVDPTNQRPSYNTKYLERIYTVQRAIKQTQVSVQRVHSSIEDRLLSSLENSDKLSQREVLLVKVRQLRQELLWQTQQKQTEQENLEKYCREQDAQLNDLKERRLQLQHLSKDMEEKRTMHIQSREMLVKENAQVLFRRKQIINEMVHYIYPLKEDEKQNFYIANVKLPNAEDYQGQDDVRVSVALGFTCHLTQMVSHFMDMPLRYPMVHRGSRSTIIDHIHSKLTEKDREFPLYGKGKEKFQYNYAVFLLNKNISQLRFYCGLGTNDLRQTLPNLKSLLEQRLGVRSSSSPEQRVGEGTATLQSPPPTSLGGSQASRRSQAASSNASSYARRDFVLDPDSSSQSVSRSTSVNLSSAAEGSSIANSAGNSSPGGKGKLAISLSFPQTTDDLLKPLDLEKVKYSTQENSGASYDAGHSTSGYNSQNERQNSVKSEEALTKGKAADSAPKKNVIVEEDEVEDLFKPSDDNFFKPNTQNVTMEFSKLFSESQSDSDAISSSFGKDIATNGIIPNSDILQDSVQRSFKLVRGSAVHSEALSPCGDTTDLTAQGISDTQNGCHTDDIISHHSQQRDTSPDDGDKTSLSYSASYDDSDMNGS